MKTVILAVFVLLVISQSEALKCDCGGLKHCSSPVETCYGTDQVCASVIFSLGSRPSYFKGCMKSRDCLLMNRAGISSARCCRFDQCNR